MKFIVTCLERLRHKYHSWRGYYRWRDTLLERLRRAYYRWRDTRLGTFWSPSECGCLVRMRGWWLDDPVVAPTGERVQLRFPVGEGIRDVQIVHVCAEHAQLPSLESDPYFGCVGYFGDRVAGEHSLRLPAALTDAERLYVYLYRYTRIIWHPDTCACVIAQLFDKSDPEAGTRIIDHFYDSRLCDAHADYPRIAGWEAAKDENVHKNRSLAAIGTIVPRLVYSVASARQANLQMVGLNEESGWWMTDDVLRHAVKQRGLQAVSAGDFLPGCEPRWWFDAARILSIDISGLSPLEQARLRAAVTSVTLVIAA